MDLLKFFLALLKTITYPLSIMMMVNRLQGRFFFESY